MVTIIAKWYDGVSTLPLAEKWRCDHAIRIFNEVSSIMAHLRLEDLNEHIVACTNMTRTASRQERQV